MKKLFVAMPYGERKGPLDYEKPDDVVTIDFDAVWKKLFLPAIPAGFDTKRADELRKPGLIDRLYNEWLYDADIVLADLTFCNPNVYYELGIRQALSRRATVLVACHETKLPFDVRNQAVIYYRAFSATHVDDFQRELRAAVETASETDVASPVHVFLPGLFVRRYDNGESPDAQLSALSKQVESLQKQLSDQQARDDEDRLLTKLREANGRQRVVDVYGLLIARPPRAVHLLEVLGQKLRDNGCYDESIQVFRLALDRKPDDPELLRELGFAFPKKGEPWFAEAERLLERALALNDKDSELHGILGGLYRRRGAFERALAAYERASDLQPHELYPILRSRRTCVAQKQATRAKERYLQVRAECQRQILNKRTDHWTYLCLGQAEVALSGGPAAHAAYQKALSLAPPVQHVRSEKEQLEFLAERGFAPNEIAEVLPTLTRFDRIEAA